ncbi:hypothetical protein P154DRAFT_529843 [Amniculicola lignicola CBS 123094]|uniref:DUF7580 domain-containing protein n=1 Tax=Amniculicola lignicola CBS 123094 TaxID=1392246 RepID=A0A6A5WWM7_9PLEO|nr:hypothetical protein P154DRAFT_529843 [Amniculicola lignicola CBS 123094]
MSGVEAAGLVLGSIPLILAGLEFYAKGIAVTKRYWKYREEFKSLTTELRTENCMFERNIEMLLTGVVKPKEMAEFIADPCASRWNGTEFEEKLRGRLGAPTYESYMDTIEQMKNTADAFKDRLKLSPSGKVQFVEEKSLKEYKKRLKFSLNKSDYSDLMTRLRNANSALYRMTTQTISLQSLQTSSKQQRHAIPKFSAINDRAHGFYSVLSSGWKCSCHADHSVNLRLEQRMEHVTSDDSSDDGENEAMEDPFRVLFSYSDHHTKPLTQPSPVIASKPWSWEEADVHMTINTQGTSPAAPFLPTAAKVRFKAKQAVKAALDLSNMHPIQDLCEAICTLQQPQRDVCLSLLASEIAIAKTASAQKYNLLIRPLKEPPYNPDAWSVASLRSVLHDTRFTRHDRLRLAVTLASSVLQLHETPWLHENWTKDNIYFIKRADQTMYDYPFVSQQFNASALAPTPALPLPASMSRIIRNQTLYALGVSLIELWYRKPISELYDPTDGPPFIGDPRVDLMTEWNTADRLAEELYHEAGGKYSDAVRRCIRCDFDHRANRLEDTTFQKAVYQGVVEQLKENFDFLY